MRKISLQKPSASMTVALLALGDERGWVEADLAADSGVTISGSAIWRNAGLGGNCIISGRVTYK